MPSSSPSLSDVENHRLGAFRGDHDPRRSTEVPILAPRESHRRRPPFKYHKSMFLFRVGIFLFLEVGFIILASLAATKSIPLHLSSAITLTEAKGALTVISVIWHALAIFTVRDILLHIFSAEWMEQFRRSGKLVMRETDVVSRITAGYVDQLTHFASRKATMRFRLGFVSALLLVVLNGLGPSALTVNLISLEHPMKFKVANLTLTRNLLNNDQNLLATDRANLITRLEQLENSIYGFRGQQDNFLAPWPPSDSISNNETIQYQSDVVTYKFSCSWTVPSIDMSNGVRIGDQGWTVLMPQGLNVPFSGLGDAVILPLEMDGTTGGSANNSMSAFIFVGSNTTLSPQRVSLNLEDVPTLLYQPLPSSNETNTQGAPGPVLITSLVCNPQFKILPGIVSLSSGSVWVTHRSGLPVVKNVPMEAANAIFSQSLLFATSTREAYGDQSIVNNIARILFLADASFEIDDKPAGIKPLSIDRINRQMDKILLSSAKAYLSGYRPNEDNLTFPSFEMMDTNAVGQSQELVLAASRPFLLALVAVVAASTLLIITLVAGVRVDHLQTFDLENIVKTLRLH